MEKDITDCLSELSYTTCDFDIDKHFRDTILAMAGPEGSKSSYFASMDELYPNNKLRQIMNYYLFSEQQYCFILIGYGSTGKTTFVDIIAEIIGTAYFGRSNVSLLKNSHGTAILEGKKMFEVAEAQDLDLDTANMLKSIITQNELYINPKFQLPRQIKPHDKLIMTCNNMPRFKVTDDGIIRRFIQVVMNNKITKQNPNFVAEMRADIPNIIREAIDNPFNIDDFASEQYMIFEQDAQYGFGFGEPNTKYRDEAGNDVYEQYKTMCKANGYHSRNRANFDKFVELAKIYKGRVKCDTTSNASQVGNGIIQLIPCDDEDLPF
ncbi:MAG: DUF5906 domain-containing protein [Oscillospiraceae bacterium]